MDTSRLVAREAVKLVKDGMTIGLGSGTTVNLMLEELAIRVNGGLVIKGVPSSIKTERIAIDLGIPLIDLSRAGRLDLVIDGTNEVDSSLNLIKGGGGSLVREKLIAECTEKLIIIADERKFVPNLAGQLPVEVIPFGWQTTANRIEALGIVPVLRKNGEHPFRSDNGNFILDCTFGNDWEPKVLHKTLKMLTGVVETGLFLGMADTLITVKEGNVKHFNRR